MATYDNEERLKQKKRLKRGMKVTRDLPEDEIVEKKVRNHKRLRISIILVIVVVIAGAFFGYRLYKSGQSYTTYSVISQTEITETADTYCQSFASNVIVYNRDGATYIDETGTVVWKHSYPTSMRSPVITVHGNCAAIADTQNNTICIYNETGFQGEASTQNAIAKVTVSDQGVVAAIEEDDTTSYIRFYDSSGKSLDIAVKAEIDQTGYPVDLSLNSDGTLLVVSYVTFSANSLESQVVFYNFSEVGKEYEDNLMGGFLFEQTVVGRVYFMKDRQAVAFAGNQVRFYSLTVQTTPELTKEHSFTQEINSIFYNESYAGVITASATGSTQKELVVYDYQGNEKFTEAIDFNYTTAAFTDGYTILYNDQECMIYDMSGNLKFKGALDITIRSLVHVNGSEWIVTSGESITRISFK